MAPVVGDLPESVEVTRRVSETGSWLFVLNHGASPATVAVSGTDLISGAAASGSLTVDGGGLAVVRES